MVQDKVENPPMALQERLALFKKIEEHRKRPLIIYVTSKRDGLEAEMAT